MDIKTDAHKTALRNRFFVFLDLETTGLIIQKHEILEIGALKVEAKRPFRIIDQLHVRVKPKSIELADKSALSIVGYSEKEWADGLELKDALKQLDEFAGGGILVGYNVCFDFGVLDRAYFSLGRQDPFYYHRLDVMPIAYSKLFSKRSLKRFSMGEVCKYLGICQGIKHRALDDAMTTYLLFKKLFEKN